MREFEVLRRLDHENIVKLFAVEETVGRLLGQRRMLLVLTFEVQGGPSPAHQQSRGIGVGGMGQTTDTTSRVRSHTGKSLEKRRGISAQSERASWEK